MEAVSKQLHKLIIELQSLPSLNDFVLAGGTCLALRFNHRISHDIDLFSNKIVGESGIQTIAGELKSYFQNAILFCEIINTESGNQYCFLRTLIVTEGFNIKVEIIQNIQFLNPAETFKEVRLLSLTDIGVMKLLSASSRKAKKDIYDLDFITNEIPLARLLEYLNERTIKFNKEEHKCLFDLDNDPSPIDDLALLLEFDNMNYSSLPGRPSHSTDRIEILSHSKIWSAARLSWIRKVKRLMKERGIDPPQINPIN